MACSANEAHAVPPSKEENAMGRIDDDIVLKYSGVKAQGATKKNKRKNRKSRRQKNKGQDFDDKTMPKPSNLLFSTHNVYEVLNAIGEGTYGQVFECRRMKDDVHVAVKVLSGDKVYSQNTHNEATVLTKLQFRNKHRADHHIVHLHEWLMYGQRFCLVFEMLSMDLAEFLRRRDYRPLCLEEVSNIARQMLTALQVLEENGIVHADIKPDNIMLLRNDTWPLQAKLIDFSCSFSIGETEAYYYKQTRYYRAPEVVLHVSISTPADMWSLGCVVAELMLGYPLLAGLNEADLLRLLCLLIGGPPCNELLNSSPRTTEFFKLLRMPTHCIWTIKGNAELGLDDMPTPEYRPLRGLHEVMEEHQRLQRQNNQPRATENETKWGLSLLKHMLHTNPSRRIRPYLALGHPFVTISQTQSLRRSVESRFTQQTFSTSTAPNF